MTSQDPNEAGALPCPLPERIAVLPVRSTVVYPMGATALQVSFPPNVEALAAHPDKDLVVAVVAITDPEEESVIDAQTLEKVAVGVRVLDRLNLPGGTIQITLQGLRRIVLRDVRFEHGYYTARPSLAKEKPAPEDAAEPLIERILTTVSGVASRVDRIPDEASRILRMNMVEPGRFADLVATLCHFRVPDRDEVLQRLDIRERLEYVLQRLEETWERIQEIKEDTDKPEAKRSERRDRPAEIRNRIRVLQAELGEADPTEREAIEMLRRIDNAKLPSRVASVARQEAERLRTVSPTGADAAEIRTYLDALLAMPWNQMAPEEIDLEAVRRALDAKHLGLEEVKRRIMEVISVGKLRGDVRGAALCFVGPAGVGKRSLAVAIARGLDRPLVRVEMGGRGESQLVGTRRTKSGAQMGKLAAAVRDAEVRNPVLLIEELDEIGLGSVEGDPIEAMEEFLDPRNRDEFIDRYLDVPIDLSQAVFIASAQDFYRIPRSLREYLIEIRIPGYTPEEKVDIARERLLPNLARGHGIQPEEIEADDDVLLYLTRGYARDAGLGNLRRSLSAILRNIALQKASGESDRWTLSPKLIEEVIGVPRYPSTLAESAPEVGIVTGLAWTASGGEIMFIEALKMPGTGRLIITGLLGEVMRESVNAAYSYVRSRADDLGIPNKDFGEYDVHVHFPVGATPKDGPSAGAAVTLAIASSLSERPVRHDVSMTGEVTLRGRILDIGGVKEKTLAAYRAGLREVILPAGNERDLRDVPEDIREKMKFHLVDAMDQVLQIALTGDGEKRERRKSRSSGGRGRRPIAAGGREEEEEAEGGAGGES